MLSEFSAILNYLDTYDVTITSQPADRHCEISNSSGAISAANVTDVTVTCTVNKHYVFVSSGLYDGLLGGPAGADATCLALAEASTNPAIHGKTWMAWLSSSTASPAQRMTQFPLDFPLGNTFTIL